MEIVRRIVAGVLSGFAGGALVGLAEALVVALLGGAEEYGVFGFGAIAYGCFGAGMGGGVGFVSSFIPLFGREIERSSATAAGLVVAALGLVVTRFRIIRDVFGESLPIGSTSGILVHIGLVVAAAIALFLVRSLILRAAEKHGATAAGARWSVGCVVVGIVLSFVLNTVLPAAETGAFAPGTAKGPNVLLVIVDTLRSDYTSAYEAARADTPAIAALAKDGVVFENAFSQSSWTRPSIATILTSLYPASHSVMYKTDLLPDAVETIAETMLAAGYRTSGFVTNINVAPSFNFQQGFQEYSYIAPDFFFGATDSGSKLSLYSGMRLIRERFLAKKKWVQNYYQDADVVNARALPWLDAAAEGPFFSLVHYMDPHDPYLEIPYNGVAVARVDTPHPDASERERLEELYVTNIEYLDGFLGQLIARLKEAGVYDKTAIALVADHGEEFYEHEGWWHGTTLYDEQVRIPMIFKLPNSAKAGTRVAEFGQLLDVAPTLVALAGVDAPDAHQGRDLFGDTTAPVALYAEEDHEGNVLESVRTAEWKLVIANEGNPRGLEAIELYDLVEDPAERNNLAAAKGSVVREMTEHLEALRAMVAGSAVEGATGELDEAATERLRALGYME